MDRLTVEKQDGGWRIVRTDADGNHLGSSEAYERKTEAAAAAKLADDAVFDDGK